jgi:hypothetical protein
VFVPNYLHQEHDRPFTDSEIPLHEIIETESEFMVEEVPTIDIQWEDVIIDYSQENGFFKGLLFALPVGLLLLVVLIWTIREFWMNIGGGTIGTG